MTTTATGPNGLQMQNLATRLSLSTDWQTACGVTTAAAALRFIHYPHFRDTDQTERPVAVISRTPDGGFEGVRTTGGGSNGFVLSGALMLTIIDRLEDFTDEKEPDVLFHNFTEAIVQHLFDGAAVSDSFPMSGLTATIPPSRTDDTQVAGQHATIPTYLAQWRLDWSMT